MAEIRKYYPPKVPEPVKEPAPIVKKRIYQNPGPALARENTVGLIKEINKLINEHLERGLYVSYYLLYTDVFGAIKEKALELCQGNVAKAARLLGMQRTTFREAIKHRLPARPSKADTTEPPPANLNHSNEPTSAEP